MKASHDITKWNSRQKAGAGEMTEQVKAPAAQTDNPSLVPRVPLSEGKRANAQKLSPVLHSHMMEQTHQINTINEMKPVAWARTNRMVKRQNRFRRKIQ